MMGFESRRSPDMTRMMSGDWVVAVGLGGMANWTCPPMYPGILFIFDVGKTGSGGGIWCWSKLWCGL